MKSDLETSMTCNIQRKIKKRKSIEMLITHFQPMFHFSYENQSISTTFSFSKCGKTKHYDRPSKVFLVRKKVGLKWAFLFEKL